MSSIVILAGLITTALALVGGYALDECTDDFNIMGWRADCVLPVGALIVGWVAASGYGLASWFGGIKITRGRLWTLALPQIAVCFAVQYIELRKLHLQYRADGRAVGFLGYYDFVARSFVWKEHDGGRGQPLGAWGYFFRALEVAGQAKAG